MCEDAEDVETQNRLQQSANLPIAQIRTLAQGLGVRPQESEISTSDGEANRLVDHIVWVGDLLDQNCQQVETAGSALAASMIQLDETQKKPKTAFNAAEVARSMDLLLRVESIVKWNGPM